MIMAPQLRQSLEMLQMPILELRAAIQQEIESNPTIEDVLTNDLSVDAETAPAESKPDSELDFDREFEVLAQLDDEWRDYFFQNLQNNSYSPEAEEKRQHMLDSIRQPVSLQSHLLEQLNLVELSAGDHQLGVAIIGSLNDDGYLAGDLEEMARQSDTKADSLLELLAVIQEFHPSGVGARDLRECLLLQLARLSRSPEISLAEKIVRDHLDLLSAGDFSAMAKVLSEKDDAIKAAVSIIKALNPRPGSIFHQDVTCYINPEVQVQKVDGKYVVIVDDDLLPHVRISAHYRRLMRADDTPSEVRSYIRERIRSGVFMIRSLQQRQKTIFRIASEIVERQQEFLEQGVSSLKPMTMAEVAEKVGVHETTVSRTVANKYMRTPRGIFEMKYFFTPGIRTEDGSEVSNQTVKDLIRKMVRNEDPSSPLSDQAIQKLLARQGIKLARRTVAKYRLILRIPTSRLRKRR